MKITPNGIKPEYGDKPYVVLVEINGEYKIMEQFGSVRAMAAHMNDIVQKTK